MTASLGHPARIHKSSGAFSGRRSFLGGMTLLTSVGAAALLRFGPTRADLPGVPAASAFVPPPAPVPVQYTERDRAAWVEFRRRFVAVDGRVVDTGNGGVSHSEGQGWGLLMACAFDDMASFASILRWTQENLACRGDCLHAWRYRPGAAKPVEDLNNATDGDLFIAAALARAAVRWDRPDYRQIAELIGNDILRLAVKQVGPWTVLLPGTAGFEHADATVVNPSYYTFALFADLAAICPSPLWDRLTEDGLALVMRSRTGPAMLPPDWVRVDRRSGALSPAAGWPARFSYDAIRIPMHIAWARRPAPALFDSFRRYWTAGMHHPAWADLRTGEVSPYAAGAGIRAVAAFVGRTANFNVTETVPSVIEAADYYSAGLIVLSRIAGSESRALA